MCGIAGFADITSRGGTIAADRSRLAAMCDVMRHRGPNDEGFYVEPGVAIGMRRLSIIDLSTGHQPIHNEDRSVWVVFNGEIYNYRELRDALEAAGHRFYTSSDTETIVHGYEEWGEHVFSRLRGMFAIAIWDMRQRTRSRVPDRQTEHPAQARDRLLTPLLVSVDDDFGIGGRIETMPRRFELAPELAIVVDFAVEDDPHGAILVVDRLVAGG